MDITALTYPAFRANQVLTSAHLNDLFAYLDEQQRLTRADLIGIGIACGLEVTFEEPGTVHLTRGCGVTSQGYLVMEPADLALAWAKPYRLPTGEDYTPFLHPGEAPRQQVDLWELFPDDDEPGAAPLATVVPDPADKAVVLFQELRRDDQRTCRPDDCDDRGARVTAGVRRLLVDVADLDAILAALEEAGTVLGPDIEERLGLPDLRMPRIDLPPTGTIDTDALLRAFQTAFSNHRLVQATAQALGELYQAFRPLLLDTHPIDPSGAVRQRFGFLDEFPSTPDQVLFLPYYWDLFDDLLTAYQEARWAGTELRGACCPPGDLFARHLVAGVLDPTRHHPDTYRHHFLPSPAVGEGADRTRTFRTLFDRLVAMVLGFTEKPPAKDIRATPSRWGDAVLGEKAIPYYYDLTGTPPLYRLWDPVKTARRRAHHNLGYRADEYSPAAPVFVTDPLRFDLEPNNFLRIEGHLGRDVRDVVAAVQQLRATRRLPFELVAVRTGAFDEGQDVDPDRHRCRFRDLDTLYATLRAGLRDFLVTTTKYFYTLPFESPLAKEPATPSLRLLRRSDPDFVATPDTLGRLMETSLTWKPGAPRSRLQPVTGTPDLAGQALGLVTALSDLSDRLADDVQELDFGAIADQHRRIAELADQMTTFATGSDGGFDRPGLADRLAEISARGREDAFTVLAEEYRRRIREAQQAQFLDHFLQRHPGVQHKAGVPLGGTFVLVYHGPPRARDGGVRPVLTPVLAPDLSADLAPERKQQLEQVLDRLDEKPELAEDADIRLLYRALTGRDLHRGGVPILAAPGSRAESTAYDAAVGELAGGTVVADFFLPSSCGSDCPPILCTQTEPPTPLTVTAALGCTSAAQRASARLTVEGAAGKISVQVDDGDVTELTGNLMLAAGPHTIVVRDENGRTSAPLAITVPPVLSTSTPKVVVDDRRQTYRVEFAVQGGTPPYTASPGTLTGAAYASPDVPVAEALAVKISDGAGCDLERNFTSGVEPCNLPCGGESERWGHRFWLPEPEREFPLQEHRTEVLRFVILDEQGRETDLTDKVADILRQAPDPLEAAAFPEVVKKWLALINELVAGAVGSTEWFRLEYADAEQDATTGTLFVERLSCLSFQIELRVRYHRKRGGSVAELLVTYSPDGTLVADPRAQEKVTIPPFNGTRSNKCRPSDPEPVCPGVELRLVARQDGALPQLFLTAELVGADAPQVTAVVWEVEDAIPPLFVGERIQVQDVETTDPPQKRARVTAITERGCAVGPDAPLTINIRGVR